MNHDQREDETDYDYHVRKAREKRMVAQQVLDDTIYERLMNEVRVHETLAAEARREGRG